MAQHVQYRPIGAGQLVGQAVEGYRRLFRHLVVPTCLLILPALAAAGAIGTSVYLWLRNRDLISIPQGANSTTLRIASSAVGKIELSFVAVGLVILLSMTLMSAVTAAVVAQGYIGVPLSWRHAMRVAFRRLPSLLLSYLIVGLIFGLLSLPSLVVALMAQRAGSSASGALSLVNLVTSIVELYLGVAFVILPAVIVLEGTTGPAALGRTLALVRGRWWGTLGAMVLVGLVQLVTFFALSVVLGFVLTALGGAAGSLAALGLCGLLLFPLYGVAATLIYFDLRNRHGGLDLALLAGHLGSQVPTERSQAPPTGRWSPRSEWEPSPPGDRWSGWGPSPGAQSPPGHWERPSAGQQPSGWGTSSEPDVASSEPGPDPGAVAPSDPGAGVPRPMWPAVSPKPPARRPAAPSQEPDSPEAPGERESD